ncbi:MAG TPA: FGGY family carbohydrate kinase [Tepidisphaeraceae bacterium]|nr:FGGY family carbohydrate kinase [Tepidisphaeraceae bacterium]
MILAIDLGSTSFKFGLFNGGESQRIVHVRVKYHLGPNGTVEIDPAVVRQSVRQGFSKLNLPAKKIRAIAITSQAQTFSVTNSHGKPIRPFISWQDGRAQSEPHLLKRRLPDFKSHCSFGSLLAALQVCQIRHSPLKPDEKILNLPSYLVELWCSQSLIDDNLAAMNGLYSLKLRQWWPAALRACGISTGQLPRIVPIGSIAATAGAGAHDFGLPLGVPIVLAGNDQTAAAFDAGLHRGPSLLITLGTAQVAYVCSKRLPRTRAGLIRGTYPGGLFYRMAADGCGGNIVNWAETILSNCATDDRFFELATRGRNAVDFDASFDLGNGAWRGLGFHHTAADLARSVLVSLSRRMAGHVARMGIDLSKHKIYVSGGGAAQGIWINLLSEALGTKVMRSATSPLSGAARMAAEALNVHYSPE